MSPDAVHPVASSLAAAAVPWELWGWVVLTVAVASGASFWIGVWYGRNAHRRAVDGARHHLQALVAVVLETLDAADYACRALRQCGSERLLPNQVELLESRHARLADSVAAIAEKRERSGSAAQQPEVIAVTWTMTPADPATGLPGREALFENLQRLIGAGVEGGVLLVRIDRLPQLARRAGHEAATRLLGKAASVLCRGMRDQDLVCRHSADTFVVLMPAISAAAGQQRAEVLRDSIRHHHFRVDDAGPEILLTASFGYAVCRPGDTSDLMLGRAADALDRSARIGRNQLHVHDGEALTHLAVSA